MNHEEKKQPVYVLTECVPFVGIIGGWHVVLPCPDHCVDLYGNSVWVKSCLREKPVRLLEHEIIELRG